MKKNSGQKWPEFFYAPRQRFAIISLLGRRADEMTSHIRFLMLQRLLFQVTLRGLSVIFVTVSMAALVITHLARWEQWRPPSSSHRLFELTGWLWPITGVCWCSSLLLVWLTGKWCSRRRMPKRGGPSAWVIAPLVIAMLSFFFGANGAPKSVEYSQGQWQLSGRFTAPYKASEAEAVEMLWYTCRFLPGPLAVSMALLGLAAYGASVG